MDLLNEFEVVKKKDYLEGFSQDKELDKNINNDLEINMNK